VIAAVIGKATAVDKLSTSLQTQRS